VPGPHFVPVVKSSRLFPGCTRRSSWSTGIRRGNVVGRRHVGLWARGADRTGRASPRWRSFLVRRVRAKPAPRSPGNVSTLARGYASASMELLTRRLGRRCGGTAATTAANWRVISSRGPYGTTCRRPTTLPAGFLVTKKERTSTSREKPTALHDRARKVCPALLSFSCRIARDRSLSGVRRYAFLKLAHYSEEMIGSRARQ